MTARACCSSGFVQVSTQTGSTRRWQRRVPRPSGGGGYRPSRSFGSCSGWASTATSPSPRSWQSSTWRCPAGAVRVPHPARSPRRGIGSGRADPVAVRAQRRDLGARQRAASRMARPRRLRGRWHDDPTAGLGLQPGALRSLHQQPRRERLSDGAPRNAHGAPLLSARGRSVRSCRSGRANVREGDSPLIPDNSLAIVDCNFLAAGTPIPIAAHGHRRHWLIRAKSDTTCKIIRSLRTWRLPHREGSLASGAPGRIRRLPGSDGEMKPRRWLPAQGLQASDAGDLDDLPMPRIRPPKSLPYTTNDGRSSSAMTK